MRIGRRAGSALRRAKTNWRKLMIQLNRKQNYRKSLRLRTDIYEL